MGSQEGIGLCCWLQEGNWAQILMAGKGWFSVVSGKRGLGCAFDGERVLGVTVDVQEGIAFRMGLGGLVAIVP